MLLTRSLLIDSFLCVLVVMDTVDFGLEYSTILNTFSLRNNIVVDNCEITFRPVVKLQVWNKLFFILFIEF
jgi:hypothetical protein